MTVFLQALIDGLLTGGIYACVAAGLSLSYGVMRIFNWAQGDCIMMALYMAIFLITGTGVHPLLAVLILAPAWFIIGFLPDGNGGFHVHQLLHGKVTLYGIDGVKDGKTLLRPAKSLVLQVLLKGTTYRFLHLIFHSTRKVASKGNDLI